MRGILVRLRRFPMYFWTKGWMSMYFYEIGREITKIQEREHMSVVDIFACVPPAYASDNNKLFRYLAAWNSFGRWPQGIEL